MIRDKIGMSARVGWLKVALLAAVAGALPACNEPDQPGTSEADVYKIAITAGTPGALPKCTSALGGTTAYVQSPSSLWSCSGSGWFQIPCANALAGAVAYSSATKTLYACTTGQWTLVPLPTATGPAGPQGSPGTPGANGSNGSNGTNGKDGTNGEDGKESLVKVTPEPAGPACAVAGQRIDVGLDTSGNGTLDASEILQTAYVCGGAPRADAGVPSSDSGAASPADAGTPSGGSETILLSTGAGPAVVPSHDFGGVVAGTLSPAVNVTLSNPTAMTITNITASTGGPPYFVTDSTCESLPAGASCTLSVRFAPTYGPSSWSAFLVIGGRASDGSSIAAKMKLIGAGLSPASLSVSRGSVDLGAVLVGASSPPFPVTVTNIGQGSTGPIAVALQQGYNYAVAAGADGCSGKRLDPGMSCTLEVRSAPSSAGASVDYLSVSAPSGGVAGVSLSGTGLALGSVFVTPSFFDFGTRRLADPALKTTFSLVNSGAFTATFNANSVSADFVITGGSCQTVLQPGQTCTLEVSFAATSVGARTGRLQFGATTAAYAALSGISQP